MKKNQNKGSSVAILLGTYNGEQFLDKQLDSFALQSYENWKVFASDDGSEDSTKKILLEYQGKWGEGRLSVYTGPKKGFAKNFYSLICNSAISTDYYAYSDQDDIWGAEKLQQALNWLQTVPKEEPALYCSRTNLVDEDNIEIGQSPLFTRPPLFSNALMQNIAGGNTMVFNEAAANLLRCYGDEINVFSHDWWTYLVIAGGGGRVFYDPLPTVRYRQHSKNLIGANSNWIAKLFRVKDLFDGRTRIWTDKNIQALQTFRPKLTAENRGILDQFILLRKQKLIPRLVGLKRSGVYRQTFMSNVGLLIGVIFKKI
ncbi:MAG: glycosyltransferase family 2 protein [Colwellia sp.]|jgi:Glycosyltransferases involved in cell wall biogenesis